MVSDTRETRPYARNGGSPTATSVIAYTYFGDLPQTPGPPPANVAACTIRSTGACSRFPRMVGDLLRAVGDPDWLGDVDLDTLQRLPAEHVGDRGQQRRGDAAWRVRFRNGWLYLLVLLEFQSSSDALMALRNLEYTALLYRELGRRGELGKPGRWPPVLPVVLYNGDAPWTAALQMRDLVAPVPAALSPFQPSQRSLLLDERRIAVDDLPLGNLMRAVVGFEQSRTPADVARVAEVLRGWLHSPRDTDLGRAFAAWMGQMVARINPDEAGAEPGETLEEATMTLVERIAQWPEQWRLEGVAQGHREGVARQRALLGRVAAGRFGEAVGARVEALLGNTEDWDRLVAAAELIAAAGDEAELVHSVTRAIRTDPVGTTARRVP